MKKKCMKHAGREREGEKRKLGSVAQAVARQKKTRHLLNNVRTFAVKSRATLLIDKKKEITRSLAFVLSTRLCLSHENSFV